MIFAAADEFHQSFVASRTPSLGDAPARLERRAFRFDDLRDDLEAEFDTAAPRE